MTFQGPLHRWEGAHARPAGMASAHLGSFCSAGDQTDSASTAWLYEKYLLDGSRQLY